MTAIDWTKPVEAKINAEYRPAMMLYALGNDTPYGFAVTVADITALYSMTEPEAKTIRNVAPKPVLREAWVVWDSDGMETVWCDEKSAADRARHFRGVYARAAVMSDGSPVEDANDPASLVAVSIDRDHWKAKAEALQAEKSGMCEACGGLRGEWEAIKSEVDGWRKWETELANPRVTKLMAEISRMRPVYDAAVAWAGNWPNRPDGGISSPLWDAVLAAQQTEPQPKPISDSVCPTCHNDMRISDPQAGMQTCPDCGGTSKETRHD